MEITEFRTHAEIEDAHWWFRARREIILDQLEKVLPSGQDNLIAEIGCGTGGNLKFLSHYYRVIGVDIAPEAVEYAKKRVNCDILLGDFRDALSNKWQQLDAVILADVLEHVEDDRTFLQDIISCLKENALIVITVPAHAFLWSSHDVILGHQRRYSKKTLRSLWERLPVRQIMFSPFNFFLFPAILIYRIMRANASNSGKSDLKMPAAVINKFLYRIFTLEKLLLKRMSLPWGSSYLAVLIKTGKT